MSGDEKVKKNEKELNPEHAPKDLVIDAPGPDDKGFLKRQNTLVRFMHQFEEVTRGGTYDPDIVEGMVDYVLTYISVPEDRKEAKELLWELSENQFKYVMLSIQGTREDLVPPTSESP